MAEPAGVHHPIKHDRVRSSATNLRNSVKGSQVLGTKRRGPFGKVTVWGDGVDET
jgi:hypothetical protein